MAASGLCYALLCSSREQALILFPVFVYFIYRYSPPNLWGRFRKMALFSGAILLGLSFYLYHNYRVTGDLVLTTTQSGYNFYLAQQKQYIDPYFRPVDFADLHPERLPHHFHVEAWRRSGQRYTAQGLNNYWIKEGFKEITAAPWIAVKKTFFKALSVVSNFEYEDNYNTIFHTQFFPALKLFFVNFSALFTLALLGFVSYFRKNQYTSSLLLLIATYSLSFIIFFCSARYRLPLTIIMFPFAAIALRDLFNSIASGDLKNFTNKGTLVAIALLLSTQPFPGYKDFSAFNNMHALKLLRSRQVAESPKLPQEIRIWFLQRLRLPHSSKNCPWSETRSNRKKMAAKN